MDRTPALRRSPYAGGARRRAGRASRNRSSRRPHADVVRASAGRPSSTSSFGGRRVATTAPPSPVAIIVTRRRSSIASSITVPTITIASSAVNSLIVFITSWYSFILSPDDAVMLTSTPRAPARFTSSSSGLFTACCAATRARSAPPAIAEPIIAIPTSLITVRTSAKSTLTRPGLLITSAIPRRRRAARRWRPRTRRGRRHPRPGRPSACRSE